MIAITSAKRGTEELLDRGGLQFHRHRLLRRGGDGAGAMDERRRAALRPLGGRHPPAQPFQKNRRYLKERVTETLGLLYADHFPIGRWKRRAACGARPCTNI